MFDIFQPHVLLGGGLPQFNNVPIYKKRVQCTSFTNSSQGMYLVKFTGDIGRLSTSNNPTEP